MFTLLFCLLLSPDLPRSVPLRLLSPVKESTGYLINDETDIRFNGKPCKYKDIPSDAEIIEISIGKDNRTLQRLYFRTKGK